MNSVYKINKFNLNEQILKGSLEYEIFEITLD